MKKNHCDGELKSIVDEVADILDISMKYANPDDHVPKIDKNKQFVKDIFRIAYYRLTYKNTKVDDTTPCDDFHKKTKYISN